MATIISQKTKLWGDKQLAQVHKYIMWKSLDLNHHILHPEFVLLIPLPYCL